MLELINRRRLEPSFTSTANLRVPVIIHDSKVEILSHGT